MGEVPCVGLGLLLGLQILRLWFPRRALLGNRYTAGEPKNLPDLYFGPSGVNLGGILAWEFLLMHWVEVRRWQDYKVPGSVNQVRLEYDFAVS